MKKRLLTVLSFPVLVSGAISAQSSQSDPRIGTWTLNVAKSKGITHKSEKRTYTQSGDSVTVHVERVNSDGTKQTYGFDATADGKDHPFTGTNPVGAETICTKRVGNVIVGEGKKGGKLLLTTTSTFAANGKVMTQKSRGVAADGRPIDEVRVYDKQ